MKAPKFLLAGLVVAGSFISCEKDDNDDPVTETYRAELRGTTAIPTNSSSGTGTFTGNYRSNSGTMNFTLAYAGTTTPTTWNITSGTMLSETGLVFDMGVPGASPVTGSITLSAAQHDSLNAGHYFVTIYSLGFPNGEIRGKIEKQ